MRLIYCAKLCKKSEGLSCPPFPGKFGDYIYNNISKDAWKLWLQKQTIIINENRLSMTDIYAREFLKKQAKIFFLNESNNTS